VGHTTISLRHQQLPQITRYENGRWTMHGHTVVERDAIPRPQWLIHWPNWPRPT
jgi:hypothetical protein